MHVWVHVCMCVFVWVHVCMCVFVWVHCVRTGHSCIVLNMGPVGNDESKCSYLQTCSLFHNEHLTGLVYSQLIIEWEKLTHVYGSCHIQTHMHTGMQLK